MSPFVSCIGNLASIPLRSLFRRACRVSSAVHCLLLSVTFLCGWRLSELEVTRVIASLARAKLFSTWSSDFSPWCPQTSGGLLP